MLINTKIMNAGTERKKRPWTAAERKENERLRVAGKSARERNALVAREAPHRKVAPKTITVKVRGKSYEVNAKNGILANDLGAYRRAILKNEHPNSFKEYLKLEKERNASKGNPERYRELNKRMASVMTAKPIAQDDKGPNGESAALAEIIVPKAVRGAVNTGLKKAGKALGDTKVPFTAQFKDGKYTQKNFREVAATLQGQNAERVAAVEKRAGKVAAGVAAFGLGVASSPVTTIGDLRGTANDSIGSMGDVATAGTTPLQKGLGLLQFAGLAAPVVAKGAGGAARAISRKADDLALTQTLKGGRGARFVDRGAGRAADRAFGGKIAPDVLTPPVRPVLREATKGRGTSAIPEGLEATGRVAANGKPVLRGRFQSPPPVADDLAEAFEEWAVSPEIREAVAQATGRAPAPVVTKPTAPIVPKVETPSPVAPIRPNAPAPKNDGVGLNINKGGIADARETFGLDAIPAPERKTILESFAEADALNASRRATVAQRATQGKGLNDAEMGALGQDLVKAKQRLASLSPDSEEYLDTLAEFDDLTVAFDRAGTTGARGQGIRRTLIGLIGRNDFSYATVRGRAIIKAQGKGDNIDRTIGLDPKVEADLRKLTDDYAAAETKVKDLEAGNASLEAEVARLRAQEIVGGRSARKRTGGERRQELDAEFSDLVSRLKAPPKTGGGMNRNRQRGAIDPGPLADQAGTIYLMLQNRTRATGLSASQIVDEIVTRLRVAGLSVTRSQVRSAVAQGRADATAGERLATVRGQVGEADDALRSGDLASGIPEPKPTAIDPIELRIAKNKRDKLRGEIRRRIADQEPRTKVQKVGDYAGLVRSLKATADNSGIGRQGLIVGLSNPIRYARAIKRSKAATFSESRYLQYSRELGERAGFDEARLHGLHFDDPLSTMGGERAEDFSRGGNLLDALEQKGRLGTRYVGTGINAVTKGAERSMATVLNHLRMDSWERGMALAKKTGRTSDADLKQLAEYINNVTGRGRQINKNLDMVLFSQRFMASRFIAPTYIFRGGPAGQLARRQFGTAAAFWTSLATVAIANGATVSVDPESSDFLKIKIGNQLFDPGAGFLQVARLVLTPAVTLYKNAYGRNKDGSKIKPRSIIGETGRALGPFLAYKASPQIGLLGNALSGVNVVGEKTSVGKELATALLPLIAVQTYEQATKTGPMSRETALTFFGELYGVGSSYRKPGDKKKPEGRRIPLKSGNVVLPRLMR